MKRISRILLPVFIFSLILTLTASFAITFDSEDYGWKVKRGDFKNYILNKWYSISDLDNDSNPNDLPMQFEDINKRVVNVTYKTGLKIRIEIINVSKTADLDISKHDYYTRVQDIAIMNVTFDESVILLTYEFFLLWPVTLGRCSGR